ncbi:hypothetical protein DACRYDRAFT_23279 [Dacryopinax primogenitus]|uniref:Protein kinase domain-containing protein n=1 Tax=Dacryopinax primogenitus (strain DJM 731) TaxID=1858805 RepID=M5G9C0_DACPD|nr:uncharacterized protein DACRYDRAFT_23279 [Dacryopinax primogenitus]EJU00388.1 hypothetical protein DACRYDRAFT_23279 [Dacryopinax primogenitus]
MSTTDVDQVGLVSPNHHVPIVRLAQNKIVIGVDPKNRPSLLHGTPSPTQSMWGESCFRLFRHRSGALQEVWESIGPDLRQLIEEHFSDLAEKYPPTAYGTPSSHQPSKVLSPKTANSGTAMSPKRPKSSRAGRSHSTPPDFKAPFSTSAKGEHETIPVSRKLPLTTIWAAGDEEQHGSLFVGNELYATSDGMVHEGTWNGKKSIIKVSRGEEELADLKEEVDIYRRLQPLWGVTVAEPTGLFEDDMGSGYLVLAWCGESVLEEPGLVSKEFTQEVKETEQSYFKLGVRKEDLWLDSIRRGADGKLKMMDFESALMDDESLLKDDENGSDEAFRWYSLQRWERVVGRATRWG